MQELLEKKLITQNSKYIKEWKQRLNIKFPGIYKLLICAVAFNTSLLLVMIRLSFFEKVTRLVSGYILMIQYSSSSNNIYNKYILIIIHNINKLQNRNNLYTTTDQVHTYLLFQWEQIYHQFLIYQPHIRFEIINTKGLQLVRYWKGNNLSI